MKQPVRKAGKIPATEGKTQRKKHKAHLQEMESQYAIQNAKPGKRNQEIPDQNVDFVVANTQEAGSLMEARSCGIKQEFGHWCK